MGEQPGPDPAAAFATGYQADDQNFHFWDGDAWRSFEVWTDLFWVAVTADVTAASGQTATLASAQVAIVVPALLTVEAVIPALHFTATSGGQAALEMSFDGVTGTLGHASTDRAFEWPCRLLRRDTIDPITGTLALLLRSITGAVTAHADDGTAYGAISWRAAFQPIPQPRLRQPEESHDVILLPGV